MEINATIIVSTISFLLFIFIMNAIMYKPVANIIEQRDNYIKDNKNEADKHKQKAADLMAEKDAKIFDTKQKSKEAYAGKIAELKNTKNASLAENQKTLNADLESKKQDLENEKKVAANTLKSSVADLANKITTKILGEGIDFKPLSEEEINEVINV